MYVEASVEFEMGSGFALGLDYRYGASVHELDLCLELGNLDFTQKLVHITCH